MFYRHILLSFNLIKLEVWACEYSSTQISTRWLPHDGTICKMLHHGSLGSSSWSWAILELRFHGALGQDPCDCRRLFLLNMEFPHDHLTVFSTRHHGTTITWYINASNSSCYKKGEIEPLGTTGHGPGYSAKNDKRKNLGEGDWARETNRTLVFRHRAFPFFSLALFCLLFIASLCQVLPSWAVILQTSCTLMRSQICR